MKPRPPHPFRRLGMALIVVLSFVVLISGIVMAVFSRAVTMRQVSQSSYMQGQADELARSALAVVAGSLRQEVVNGSTADTSGTFTLYVPTNAAFMLPQRNVAGSGTLNLVRMSSTTPVPSPGVDPFPASSAVTTATSTNGRSISGARWNRHYLLARASTAAQTTDATPLAPYTPPNWVYVTGDGPVALTAPAASALGRYAYAVYDESGLLDMNAAGYPSLAPASVIMRKGPLAFADLSRVVSTGSMADNIVGWRAYATAQASGTSIRYLSFNSANAAAYCSAVLANTNGFMKTGGAIYKGRTDQVFLSRQELLQYRNELKFSVNALAHMGTFSRGVTAPWRFHSLRRASGGNLEHFCDDGDAAYQTVEAGMPLLQSRFSLARLALVPAPGQTAVKPEALAACFGIVSTASASGTLTAVFTGQAGDMAPAIESLGDVAKEEVPREPNFFELLKAAVTVRSTGAAADDGTVRRLGLDMIAKYQASPGLFQSVGGLAYVRDFWGDAYDYSALLDVFSAVDDPPLAAGRFNPNHADAMTLYAMLSKAATNEAGSTFSDTAALNLAVSLAAQVNAAPITDNSGLVAALASAANRQGALAALASASNPRTWNLLIDVIAQTGAFAPGAASLDAFTVRSERRLWLHLAIDRFTGRMVEALPEPVYE